MRGLLLAAAALTVAGCECAGLIEKPAGSCSGCELVPVGDQASCTHQVSSAGAPTAQWEPTGPSGGRVSAALSIPGVVLIGTGYARGFGVISGRGGSIFRSVDQGLSYTPVLRVPGALVTALISVPGTTHVYAAVSPGGVYLSTDNGSTFTADNGGLFAGVRVRALASASGVPERLYALVEGSAAAPNDAVASLYRRDAGGAWTLAAMTGVNALMGGPVLGVAADATDRDRVYVADGFQFYASSNAGEAFTPVATGPTLFGAVGLANVNFLRGDPGDANHLLLATTDDGLLETIDQGMTWKRITDAAGINAVYFSAGLLWVGTRDSGLLTGASNALHRIGTCLIDPSVTAVTPLVDAPEVLIAGTTGNAYASVNRGAAFAPSSGLDEVLGRVVAAGDSVWLMSAAGLYRTQDGAQTWSRVAPGVGSISFSDVAVDPKDPNHLFLATDEDLFEGSSPATSLISYRTDDRTFERPTGLGRNLGAVAVDAAGTVYAYQRQGVRDTGTQPIKTGVFVSTDSGKTFAASTVLSSSLVLKATWRFSPLALSSNGSLFAGAVNATSVPALERAGAAAASPVEVWTGAGWVPHGVHVAKSGEVYLVGRGASVGVRKSSDNGMTFANGDTGLTGLAQQVYHLGFAPSGGLVVATQAGVHYAADKTNFSELTGFTGPAPIAWSVAVSSTPAPVVIATTNAGVFRRLLP